VIALAVLELKQTDPLNLPASRRMSPKLVTRNGTHAEVGGIVLGIKSSPKNSINESDEKKPPKSNHSYLTEGRGIKFDSRNHSQIDGSRENVALGNC